MVYDVSDCSVYSSGDDDRKMVCCFCQHRIRYSVRVRDNGTSALLKRLECCGQYAHRHCFDKYRDSCRAVFNDALHCPLCRAFIEDLSPGFPQSDLVPISTQPTFISNIQPDYGYGQYFRQNFNDTQVPVHFPLSIFTDKNLPHINEQHMQAYITLHCPLCIASIQATPMDDDNGSDISLAPTVRLPLSVFTDNLHHVNE